MKLKKIASLALAGIMAVSMLAGCKDGSSSSEPTNPVTPVTGAAAIVNNELSNNKDNVSFTDNSILTDLLANFYKENPIEVGTWTAGHANLVSATSDKLWDAVMGLYDVDKKNNIDDASNRILWLESAGSKTYCNIYWVNNDFVTKDDALRMVGQAMDNVTLPKDNYVKANANPSVNEEKATLDYTYTGSVAAIEAQSKGGTESVWVIAVTVTQTATNK